MTDAEIAACRKDEHQGAPSKSAATAPSVSVVGRGSALLAPEYAVPQEDPRIGMTTADAPKLKAWCGAYPKINRTVSQSGTREQWVCRMDGRYLYFDNGRLTTISD
jgi:hypothetical protein